MNPTQNISFDNVELNSIPSYYLNPDISSTNYTDIVWNRKRTQLPLEQSRIPPLKQQALCFSSIEPTSIVKDINRVNNVIVFCDDVLRMFDELVMPAARLLDNVESKLKDYSITHPSTSYLSPKLIENDNKQLPIHPKYIGNHHQMPVSISKPEGLVKHYETTLIQIPNKNSHSKLSVPASSHVNLASVSASNLNLSSNSIVNPKTIQKSLPKQSSPIQPLWINKTVENTRLQTYTSIVFAENDRINWLNCLQCREQQRRQAEEEAETDDDMIEYGLKVANKAVRGAIKGIKTRDWSIKSRIEYYKNSIKRLHEINRKRGR